MNSNHTPRTIYFVWHYTNWGGAQIFLLAIMKIARPEWNLKVILPADSAPDFLGFLDKLGVGYEYIESSLEQSQAVTIADKLSRQYRRVRTEFLSFRHLMKYDLRDNILHIEAAPWQSWILLAGLSLRGANVFMTLHNFLGDAPKWRTLLWKARMQIVSRLPGMHVIASNHDTKNRMRGWVSEKFWTDVTVAHTCVDPVEIEAARIETLENRASLLAEHSIPADRTVVLAVGQFIDRKGRWVFLEAAKIVRAQSDDFQFVWLTPEMPSDADRERIESFGLGDAFRVVRSGSLGPERGDVLRFFNIADIFALPSYVEGLPIALLEAMALGIPAISTNVYAIPEAVIDGETGMLIEAGDPHALATVILELADNPELRQRLAIAGSRYVIANFDEVVAAEKCLAAYRRCFAHDR